MIKGIITIVLAYFVIKYVSTFFFSSKPSKNRRKDGDVSMNSRSDKKSKDKGVIKDGEYVDYEEVKD